jgi:hypothetical protein
MNHKLKAALTLGVLFFLLSSPSVYSLVDSLVPGSAYSGKPTTQGLVLHSLVFAGLVYLMMPRT